MTADLTTGTIASLNTAEEPIRRHGVVRRTLREPAALISAAFLLVVVIAAVFAPLLTPYDPTASKLSDVLAPPFTPEHPLGADGVGKDILANLLYGAQTSLSSAVIVVAVSVLIGVPTGLLAGYRQGRIDGAAMWISGMLLSLPAIVIILVVLARVGRSTNLALVVFGVLIAPSVFLLIRGSVRAVREELYVDAAKVSGLRDARIMRRHILPVVITPTIIQAALLASAGIGIEAGIAFLGLGSADKASWGLMLADASQNIYNAPWLLVWPSIVLILTIMAFTLIGNGVRDALADYGGARSGSMRRSKRTPPASDPVTTSRAHQSPGGGASSSRNDPDALLEVSDLVVGYPRPDGSESLVVNGVSLTVKKGEVLGLVGESGSGKSQSAFSLLGLLPREARLRAGGMHFGGIDLQSLSVRDRNNLRGSRIGYIPQEPMSNLDPAFRVGYQLTEPMRHHLGLSRRAAKAEALSLLARVGIPDPDRIYRAYPHQLSGGMAQRVLIAGAVSCGPELLIADEPTTALDVTVQADVLDLIRGLQAERGLAVILVTHNFGVVADLCDRVAVMRAGEIVEVADVIDLFEHPKHEYTRLLLDSTLSQTDGGNPDFETIDTSAVEGRFS